MPETPLAQRRCRACAKGEKPLARERAEALLAEIPRWTLAPDARSIRRDFAMKDFSAAASLVAAIAPVADAEDHHPDLHLTGYRRLAVELSTHSIGGLSENDFILAAKIDALPKELKPSA